MTSRREWFTIADEIMTDGADWRLVELDDDLLDATATFRADQGQSGSAPTS